MHQALSLILTALKGPQGSEKTFRAEGEVSPEANFADELIKLTPQQADQSSEAAIIAARKDSETTGALAPDEQADVTAWLAMIEQIQNGDEIEPEVLSSALEQLTGAGKDEVRAVLDSVGTVLQEQLQSLANGNEAEDVADQHRIVMQLEQLLESTEAILEHPGEQAFSVPADVIQPLLSELAVILEIEPQQLALVDVNELKTHLTAVLDELEWEGQPLTQPEKDAILAVLQEKLQQLEGVTADEVEGTNAERQLVVEKLLQKLDSVISDYNNARPQHILAGGADTAVAPAVRALAQATEQAREQLRTAANLTGDDATDTEIEDSIRRFSADNINQSAVARVENGQQNVTTANIGNISGQTPTGSLQTVQRAVSEMPAGTLQETPRQAQQAIDILGPQAPQQLRERISLMFNSRTQAAEIRLDPPDLGRLQIRINLNQEQAAVSFQVSSPQAREALEQTMPRLREMLAEQGLNLTESNVSEHPEQNARGNSAQTASFGGNEPEFEMEEEGFVETEVTHSDGRIDYYA